jgi:hypothetical protein
VEPNKTYTTDVKSDYPVSFLDYGDCVLRADGEQEVEAKIYDCWRKDANINSSKMVCIVRVAGALVMKF